MPPGLKNTLASLDTHGTPEAFRAVVESVGGSLEEMERALRLSGSCMDVSDLSLEGLRGVMSRTFPDTDRVVMALWPSDGIGAKVNLGDLLEHIDDLYYPGMDDLLIIEEGQGVQILLLLDHEERLYTAPLE